MKSKEIMKIELKESFKFEQGEIPKGEIVLIKEVVNNERNRLPFLYNGMWNDLPVSIPAYKCFEIFEKETDPEKLKKLDDWFDKTTEDFIEIEKNYTEIIITMKKRASYYSDWCKTITYKPDGKDKITSDDVVELKDKLDSIFFNKEENSRNESFNMNYISAISSNNISFIFGSDYEESCPTSEMMKYWRVILKYLGLKEEVVDPKTKKFERYGICRYPSYTDMFYFETNARKEYIEECYNGDVKKLVNKLKKDGFKVKVVNIDYILDEGVANIAQTNKIAL